MTRQFVSWMLFFLLAATAQAKGVYLQVPDFVDQAFDGHGRPTMHTLWLDGETRERMSDLLGHEYAGLRLRYWRAEDRTAWVMEEIGKELPITIGVVVDGTKIRDVKILTYRESRGGEVRHPFFTEQFSGARLGENARLDRSIDGITGATLSVRAVTNVARTALFLHRQVTADE